MVFLFITIFQILPKEGKFGLLIKAEFRNVFLIENESLKNDSS